MKHLHTFESFVSNMNESLKPSSMKKLIDTVVEMLAGQIEDEGEDLEYYPNIEKFLKSKQGETAAMSALEGLSDEDEFIDEDDLTRLWPKMKAEVIKKVLANLKNNESFANDINEAKSLGSKISSIWNKYKSSGMDMNFGDELQSYFDEEELPEELVSAIKSLGKSPKELVDFSTVNDGVEQFSSLLADIKKSGLKFKEYNIEHGGPAVVVENK